MSKLVPWRPWDVLDKDFEMPSIFEDDFGPFRRRHMLTVADIRTDIRRTENGYEVNFELPGFEKEDIDIEYQNNVLTVSAEREEEKKEETDMYIRRERKSGSVSRSFTIKDVKEDSIKAEFKDGVLSVILETDEEKEDKRKRIEIK